jgi:hypothetical protein
MARLKIVRVVGALLVSAAVLTGCSSAPAQKETPVAQAQGKSATNDRTPHWMKYRTSSSRIARPTDGNGRPISADMVKSTDSNGLYQLPSVTMKPCTAGRSGC